MLAEYTGWFILGCFVIFLAAWAIAGLQTKRTIARGGWNWLLVPLAFAAVVLLMSRTGTLALLSGAFIWKQSLLTQLAADVITFAGLVILLWARVALGGNWSSDVAIKENHELIERGPYRWVRHPIYTGLLVMGLGGVVWSGHLIAIAVFVTAMLGLWLKSRQEEKLLTKYFPDEYPRYRARVKALIPFVL